MVDDINFLEAWGYRYAAEAYKTFPPCQPGEAFWFIDGKWVGPVKCPENPPMGSLHSYAALPLPRGPIV